MAMQCKAGIGWEKVVLYLLVAFTSASSLHSKLRTLGNPVADVATVDALGYVYSHNLKIHKERFAYEWMQIMLLLDLKGVLCLFISAWASRLLILTGWQVRRPGV